jgi:hypothetical protein
MVISRLQSGLAFVVLCAPSLSLAPQEQNRGAVTPGEAISRTVTVVNRAGSSPQYAETLSRPVTVRNHAGRVPTYAEALTRPLTVANRTGAVNVPDEAISRAASVCNSPFIDGGDLDCDADVDLGDFAVFVQCYGGAFNPPASGCPAGVDADFDDDGDIDLTDFAMFAQNYTGSL